MAKMKIYCAGFAYCKDFNQHLEQGKTYPITLKKDGPQLLVINDGDPVCFIKKTEEKSMLLDLMKTHRVKGKLAVIKFDPEDSSGWGYAFLEAMEK